MSRRAFMVTGCATLAAGLSASSERGADRRPSLPLRRGSLVRGANVTVKNSHYPRPWHNLWLEWDWAHWIRWQIDLARTLGVDCIRVIGSVSVITEGALTVDRYQSQWDQLLEYLAAQGMWAYPCVSDLRHWGTATLRQALPAYRAFGEGLRGHDNVLGIDVSNEAQYAAEGLDDRRRLLSRLAMLTATLRDTTWQPLSHSVTLGNAQDWSQGWARDVAELSDFLDLHVYYTPARGDGRPILEAPWSDLPMIVGEFGARIDESRGARIGRYLGVRDLVSSDPRFVGALAWDIASERFGLFDLSGRPRLDITGVLETFPHFRQP